jgi:hypothetical protein
MAYEDAAPAYLEQDMKTVFVKTIANMKAPTVTELTGAEATDISKWIVSDGWHPTMKQNFEDDAREGVGTVGKIPGTLAFDNTEIQVLDNINAGVDAPNVAVTTLTEGTSGFFVRRRGPGGAGKPFASGDVVSVYRVVIAKKTPVAHAGNARQQSLIGFSIAPDAEVETATVASGA